ncbi:2'-5' RNA ligase family protein [Phytohabitans kaempferiae]|uniref:2'-5' RNA ligase family protein n=1 Tax=Phytohabitans kaempferiae TaxID=1620943 RepID=A0ABV6LXL4_9ACTN
MIPDSGLVVPFPDLEHAVGSHRHRHDPRAAIGVPAHVTIHFPWIPAASVDENALEKVRELAVSVEPFEVTFKELHWFGETVLYLAPEPEHQLRDLSDRSAALWPEAPRYDGAFDDVVPHLTVGQADKEVLRPVQAALARELPLKGKAEEVYWFALNRGGRWERRAAFPLGG